MKDFNVRLNEVRFKLSEVKSMVIDIAIDFLKTNSKRVDECTELLDIIKDLDFWMDIHEKL